MQGNQIWEEKTFLHNEGSASYGLEIDSKGNCYAVGILGISDYAIPNRAYLLKYQDLTTSLSNPEIKQFLHVYPNPCAGILHIEQYQVNHAYINLQIYNLQGKLLLSEEIFSPEFVLNLEKYRNQFCLMRITKLGKIIYSNKLFIE
ncbi:MAG: hypothetical protein IPO86_00895 [Saprospiraceae bacterium]|nr:hypothetical protein [Saprospiraceae bacterium]